MVSFHENQSISRVLLSGVLFALTEGDALVVHQAITASRRLSLLPAIFNCVVCRAFYFWHF
jgi:hypothetical protein